MHSNADEFGYVLLCPVNYLTYISNSMQEQQIRSMETEMDNCKKNIVKEQENNEKLTLLLNKVMANIMHVQGQIERSMAKREALKMEYMTYTRTLQETEQALAKVTTVSMPLIYAMVHQRKWYLFWNYHITSGLHRQAEWVEWCTDADWKRDAGETEAGGHGDGEAHAETYPWQSHAVHSQISREDTTKIPDNSKNYFK